MKELTDAYKAIYEKKANDGNLANNAPPYDKVTRRDVITGALGKDEMGGKRKAHDCAKKVNYKKEEYDCIPEQHTMLEDGTVTHYDITKDNLILHNIPVEELEILISEKHEHFDNYDKNAEVLGENRRAARAAGGYKDDSKKQTDPSKAGFTGISGSIADIMRQNKEIEARNKAKSKKEEVEVEEGYKGKHGQTDKQYADSRSPGGKMVSGDSKMSGAEYTHGRRVKAANPGMQPDVGGKTKPKSQGKMDKGTRADMMYRKAKLKKEELEATGKFTAEEIERILGIEEGLGMAVKAAGKMVAKQAAQGAVDRAGEAAYNKARNMGKKPKPACEEVEVTEHHQKDAEGKVIEHEETTPSSVEEGMKQARKNVGASTCWDGYKAKGTKKKGGKEVPNCVKEEETGGVLVQDAADYTPTEIETVDVVTPEPLKNFQIEDHGVKFSEKNEEVVVDPTELIKKHAPNIAAARPLDEIAPLAALAVGAKAMAKKAVVGAAKSAARGMATNAMSKAKDRMSGSNNNNMA